MSKVKDFKLILTHIFDRKSSGKDGLLLIMASGIGDAILSYDYICHIISYCEKNNFLLQIVCGEGAKYLLVELLGLPAKYFCKISIGRNIKNSGEDSSLYEIINCYENKEFDAVITTWSLIGATLKSCRTVTWDSKEGFKTRSILSKLLKRIIYSDCVVVPQEQWTLRSIQEACKLVGIPGIRTKIPELRPTLIGNNEPLLNCDNNYVVFSVDTSCGFRRWPDSCFIEAIKEVHERYSYHIVLVGLNISEKLSKQAQSYSYITNLCGKTSFSDIINVIGFSKFLVGVDSGNIHIAASLGIQTFAIVGKYELSKYLPYDLDVVSENYPSPICIEDEKSYKCSACLQRLSEIRKKNKECFNNCIGKTQCMKCIEGITVKQLLSKIEQFLRSKELFHK